MHMCLAHNVKLATACFCKCCISSSRAMRYTVPHKCGHGQLCKVAKNALQLHWSNEVDYTQDGAMGISGTMAHNIWSVQENDSDFSCRHVIDAACGVLSHWAYSVVQKTCVGKAQMCAFCLPIVGLDAWRGCSSGTLQSGW